MANEQIGAEGVAMAEYSSGSWDGVGQAVDYSVTWPRSLDRVLTPNEYAAQQAIAAYALPKDAKERKGLPICTGVLDYFPRALAEVARCSKVGNDQHNPGQPLHWAKEKSSDEADALIRHLIERGKVDTDGVRHSAKVAWRALAMLQRELEAEG